MWVALNFGIINDRRKANSYPEVRHKIIFLKCLKVIDIKLQKKDGGWNGTKQMQVKENAKTRDIKFIFSHQICILFSVPNDVQINIFQYSANLLVARSKLYIFKMSEY